MGELRVGDKVIKAKGYEFIAVVVAVFKNQAGEERVVCESLMIPGLLHIFNPEQMRKLV